MTHELLTPEQMYEADRLTIEAGTPGIELMENAGAACARVIMAECEAGPVCVIAGPGNNGGDGFVIARLLAEAGWPVKLMLAGDVAKLTGDAALAAKAWTGDVLPATRNTSTVPLSSLMRCSAQGWRETLMASWPGWSRRSMQALPRIAIDVPSGIDGRTGQVRGVSVEADHTITFFRAKPGHWLMPGREKSGRIHVESIGMNETGSGADKAAIAVESA
jgi:NAD(P)H-hydrate repair Nnr-like enzyme with NAD(P)H-hydrate epimerase domain